MSLVLETERLRLRLPEAGDAAAIAAALDNFNVTRWLAMTAGLLIWAAHFLGLYLLASAADVWSSTEAAAGRWIGLGFSLLCLALIAVVAVVMARRPLPDGPGLWERRVALTSALVAAVGVTWQTTPLAF